MTRHARFLLLGALILPAILEDGAVQISWNANTEPDVAGYRIYYGTVSRWYDHIVDVGLVTSHTLNGLKTGNSYYFTVSAYDTAGNESDLSSEIAVYLSKNGEVAPQEPESTVERVYNFPNPFSPDREITHLRYFLQSPALVTIRIYNVANQVVRTLAEDRRRFPGENVGDVWDGLDDAGQKVANGLYLCKLTINGKSHFIKIAVSR